MKTSLRSLRPTGIRGTFCSLKPAHVSLLFLAVLLVFQSGCATRRDSSVGLACPPRPNLGTIGVAPGERTVHVWFHSESHRVSASSEAKAGAVGAFSGELCETARTVAGADRVGPFMAAPFLAAMFVQSVGATIGGAINGAAQSVPKELAEKSARQFRDAAPREEVRHRLQALALDAVRQRTTGQVLRLAHPHWLEPKPRGVTTLLQAEYVSLRLHNHPASAQQEFRATGYATLIAVAPGSKLDSAVVEYRSGRDRTHTLAEWAANDAQLLREELERCHQNMAEQLVARLLGEAVPAGLASVSPTPKPGAHADFVTTPNGNTVRP